MLSKNGKKYYPMPAKVVERAMDFYDPAYYKNPHAIQNLDWGQSRINFQAWPYKSATNLIVDELKRTVVTGDNSFLDKLTGDFVANDLMQYDYVKAALNKYPDWKKDLSVPQSGDPFVREEIVRA